MYYAPSFSFVVCCWAMANQDATTALEAVPQVGSGELLQDSPVRRPLATEFQQVDDPSSSGDKLQANSPGSRGAAVLVQDVTRATLTLRSPAAAIRSRAGLARSFPTGAARGATRSGLAGSGSA